MASAGAVLKRIFPDQSFSLEMALVCAGLDPEDEGFSKVKASANSMLMVLYQLYGARREFLESLIDALAAKENTERQIIENRMKREQKSRDLGWKARQITGKSAKEPVLRAITTDENGDTIELNRQEDMIPVLAESNKSRQQQCENTPFMTSPLLEDFGYLPPEELAN